MSLFTTERLNVRPWTVEPADLSWAYRIYGDPQVVGTIGGQVMDDLFKARDHIQMRLDRQRDWSGRYGAWAIERQHDGVVVGTALLKPLKGHGDAWTSDIEIGWHLARMEWGKGYATELGFGLIAHARSIRLPRLYAVVEASNQRSLAVARRLGLVHQGQTTDYYDGLPLELFALDLV